ncbi:gamma-glutamyltransferase [Comamonas serinivorans]|uniref:Gamma-glutamyltransferase n=1 Tax=Comamonas serinivorans TaxID=1082851 RepID=A0A1Y0EP92_9BURK|nr:gamma-glutamyltransferase family protein [Comamonas serinivorans]ARU05443.1 gamma-glutamyltransferase [Comamonas serinivorans]
MTLTRSFVLTPLALALALAACGGGGDDDQPGSGLIVDNNANSCQVASNGGSVVVGSGDPGDPAAPEEASGYRLGYKAKYSNKYMVVANTPLATKAGCDVLKAGGTAADAAVAVQVVLGLVEPQSSTLAGSAFMLHYDAATKKVTAYDGRETAPKAATGYYLVRQDQADPASPGPVPSARRSGRSIGVPGVMRMLEMAQSEHGKLKWNQLFDEGIRLASDGFVIPARLGSAIASNAASLALDGNAMATYFHPDGTPRKSGESMTNVPYAATLRALADQGANALHTGPIAAAIVAKAAQSVGDDAAKTPITPSLMTLADLADYQPKKREPVCVTYRNSYHICSMSPPSSGGIAITQALGILENFDLSGLAPTNPSNEGGVPSVMGVHLVTEASRLAYADRDKYVADTDFVPLPGNGVSSLLNKDYLKSRALLINPDQSMGRAEAGNFGVARGIDKTEEHGTTHFSIVDAYGNVVSMTTTVEASMGSFHMTGGFLLTNQLTDFSAQPEDATGLIANRVEPGKRPRSTMAPTLVFRGTQPGDFVMATGSPGGGAIIQYVLKTVVGALDWKMDAQQATSMVDFGATNSPTTNVDGSNTTLDLTALVDGLKAKGHTVSTSAQSSGISTIMRVTKDGKTQLEGGVDPRREGIILGDGAL